MKRFLFFLIATFFAIQSFSQAALNEGFEGTVFPPDGWSIETTSGGGSWASSPYYFRSGFNSVCSEYQMGGATRWLITPKLVVTPTLNNFAFWIATDNLYPGSEDNIDIFISTTNNEIVSFGTTPILALDENDITTIWTQHTVDLSAYIGQEIYVAIRVIDNYGFNTFIDDVTGPELFLGSCPKPTSLVVSNPTTTQIDLGWTNPAASVWNIEYMLASETDWSNAISITGVTTNPYTFINLNPATTYKARVQTNCGSDISDWSSSLVFSTACDSITTFPYIENFDNLGLIGSFPQCWSRPVIYTDYPMTTAVSSYVHSAPASLELRSSFSDATYAITPQMGVDLHTLMVSFWAKAESIDQSGTLEVGVMSDPTDLSTFESVVLIEPTSTDYLQYEVIFSGTTLSGTGMYIAIRQNASSGWYYWIDDVVVDYIPDCPDVQGLAVEAGSTSSILVNWNDVGDSGDGYNIAYAVNLTQAFDPSTALIVSLSTGTPLPYEILNFNPGDSVWVAVQRGCLGNWTQAIKVTLPTSVNALPFTANFEDPNLDNVWTLTNGAQTNKWFIGSLGANDSDPLDALDERGLFVSGDLGISSIYDHESASIVFASTLIEFNDAPSFQLSFDWLSKGEANYDGIDVYLLPLGVSLNPGALLNDQYKINPSLLVNSSTFQTFTKAFNASYSNTVKQLVFAWRNDAYGGTNPPAKIDNISFVALSCGMPYDLAMDSASYNGHDVYLSWTEPQEVSSWVVEYQQSGTNVWSQVAANTNPFILTGLNSGTSYEARVRSICSVLDTSSISNVISFQTQCVPLNVPTPIEEFLTSVPPSNCWSQYEGILPSTSDAYLADVLYGGWYWSEEGTPNNAKLNIYGEMSNWLVSPSINLGDGSVTSQLEFDLFYTSYGNSNNHSIDGVDDRFAVVISTDDGATWNAANATIWSNQSGAVRVLDNLTNIPTRIIIPLLDAVGNYPYSGIIKVGFYGESTVYNADNEIHIDNFQVKLYSTCQVPTGVIANNISSTSAEINFTENGTSTSWEYVYGTSITDPTTVTASITTINPFQLTGLSPQTEYSVWVRSICGSGNSDWSNLYSFTTTPIPATVPYTCGFEDATENLSWKSLSSGVNKWSIGLAAGNGESQIGTHANYLSNDNGLSYQTSFGSMNVYTYRDIDFGTDTASFALSFDWKCKGEFSQWNNTLESGLRVYLRDPSETINPSGLPINPDDNLGEFFNKTTWQAEELYIDNVSGVKRLIFVYSDDYINYTPPAAIDNISIIEQSCSRPFNVVASNITTTSAQISWEHPSADGYILSYRQNTTGSTLNSVAILSSPYTIQNLNFGTAYVVSLKAICSGDTTMASQSLSFRTLCSDVAITNFPWTEGFEGGLDCWPQEYVSGTIDWTTTSSVNTAHSGEGFANFYDNSSSEFKTKLISPMLDISALTQPYVSFWHMQEADYIDIDELKVFYRTSLTDTWTLLVHYLLEIDSYVMDSISLPNPSSTYQIAFEGKQNWGSGVALDDITIYDAYSAPCLPPTSIVVMPSDVVAQISWTAGGGELSWELKLGESGITETSLNTSFIINGLTPNTPYTIFVRSNCGSTYSEWVSTQFTTTILPTPPSVTTLVPVGQISHTTAVLEGEYQQAFDSIQAKGFEYKAASATTWIDEVVATAATPFTYSASGLTANTSYEVKAYVTTTEFGKTYGNLVTFTTLPILPPIVSTDSVVFLSTSSATFYGKITKKTEDIEARGFEYKLSSEVWEDAINMSATGVSEISATATLIPGSYMVRAYARTLSGTEYGQVLAFQGGNGLNGVDGKEISIMMYPNPATSQTKLIVSGVNGDTKITLSDVQGRTLKTINAKPVNETIEQTIELNNLAKGIYYIRIQNSDINRTQKLIVK